MADFDREAVTEQAARAQHHNRTDLDNFDRLKTIQRRSWMEDTAAALPVIVAATLAPIEALHSMKRTVYLRRDAQGDDHWDEVQFCRGCSADWPCPTAQAIADIKAKAGA